MRKARNMLAVSAAALIMGTGFAGSALAVPPPDKPAPSVPKALSTPKDAPRYAQDRLLVKLKDGAPDNGLANTNRANGVRVKEKLKGARVSVLTLPRGLSVEEAVRRYERDGDVEYAEPDFVLYPSAVPNDTEFGNQWSLHNTGQFVGYAPDVDVDAPEAWNTEQGDPGTVVGIVDSGVDISNPDLKNNVWVNPNEIPGNGIDDDNNTYVDDINGWDFRNEDASVFDADEISHGTHVAGTVAAEGGNGIGVAGAAPHAKFASLKFIAATGFSSDAAQAIDYSVAEGIPISNNSYGSLGNFSQTLLDAIKRANTAGHLYVKAAGNDSTDTDVTAGDTASTSDSPNILIVAASDHNDELASFSNYGATTVDMAAPGTAIYNTMPDAAYAYKQGTSMAAPHVAGVAALLKSADVTLDAVEIKDRIMRTSEPKPALQGKTVTGGRLNATRALDTVAPLTSVPQETLLNGATLGATAVPTTIAWSGSDAASGVARYELEQSVGGAAFAPVALPSALATSFTLNLEPNVSQQFRVRAVDSVGNVGAWNAGPVFTNFARQENASNVTYPAGTWTASSSTAWYGGGMKYATAAGARAVYKFTGSEVTWISSKYTNRGRAEVWLDGVKVATIDTYATTFQAKKVLFKKDWGVRGTHTLEIRPTGTKNASSTSPRVDVDAFVSVY